MPTKLTSYAVENSTFAIVAAFTDENDDALTPDSITWTLCDTTGAIVNSREDVAIGSPAVSVTIVLSGDDLAVIDNSNQSETRYLEISAVFDSDLGDDLPLKDRAEFKVINLKSVT